jgi:hypothetical protein
VIVASSTRLNVSFCRAAARSAAAHVLRWKGAVIRVVEVLVERCAGLDVGKADLKACVRVPGPRGVRRQQIKTFATTTGALLELRQWLIEHQVTVVGMEATRLAAIRPTTRSDAKQQHCQAHAAAPQPHTRPHPPDPQPPAAAQPGAAATPRPPAPPRQHVAAPRSREMSQLVSPAHNAAGRRRRARRRAGGTLSAPSDGSRRAR